MDQTVEKVTWNEGSLAAAHERIHALEHRVAQVEYALNALLDQLEKAAARD